MKNIKVIQSFPILSILGLIFITLKLAGIGVVATWSWWLVLSPFWIPLAIILALLAFAGILYLIAAKLEK